MKDESKYNQAVRNAYERGRQDAINQAKDDLHNNNPYHEGEKMDWTEWEGDNYGGFIQIYNEVYNCAYAYWYRETYYPDSEIVSFDFISKKD